MNLPEFVLKHSASSLKEKSILAITSKIVSLAEGCTISVKAVDKKDLVRTESDHYLGMTDEGFHLTIKHQMLVPSAGIDESNSETGSYILYPKDPFLSLRNLAYQIKQNLSLKNFGIVMTDSRSFPLRRGVLGMALAYTGFYGLKSLVGQKDLFAKRAFRVTQMNIVDALAAGSVLLMGEGAESQPLAIIEDAPVKFTSEDTTSEMHIPLQEDIYYPLYRDLIKSR